MINGSLVIRTHFYIFATLFLILHRPHSLRYYYWFSFPLFNILLVSLCFSFSLCFSLSLSLSLSLSFFISPFLSLSHSLSFSLSLSLSFFISLSLSHTHEHNSSESPGIQGRHRYSLGCPALHVQRLESRWMYVHATWKIMIAYAIYADHICNLKRFCSDGNPNFF